MAAALNALPQQSLFSGLSPNSNVTGQPGDLVVNVGSASTSSRLWLLGGAGSALTNIGWVNVRILA